MGILLVASRRATKLVPLSLEMLMGDYLRVEHLGLLRGPSTSALSRGNQWWGVRWEKQL